MNNGRFIKGWTGQKTCAACGKIYNATSGSQKTCSNCRVCKTCLKQLKYSHRKFCNNSCSGKWKYKNSEKVRHALKSGVYVPQRAEAISKAITGKPRLYMRGENNPNWKGGVYNTERHRLMGQVEYKNWRKEVFKRDNYTCKLCNKRGVKLNADHIIPYYIDKTKVLDVNNGQTLCIDCHKSLDTYGHKVKTRYKSVA